MMNAMMMITPSKPDDDEKNNNKMQTFFYNDYRGFPLPSYTWYKVNPVTGAQEELSAAPTLFPRHTVSIMIGLGKLS